MRRIIPAILLVAILAIGGGFIATAAYQAGLNAAVTTAVSSGGTVAPVVIPAYGYGYGYGWHPFGFGFGIFGLLFSLFFLFIAFKVIGAIFFGGRRGRGPGGWGGPGGPGHHGHGPGREGFDEWHRRAHGSESPNEPPASNQGSNPT
jgi:hypothetical protein